MSTTRPVGGVAMLFEFAQAMARRGHEVHVFHTGLPGAPVHGLEDLSWFPFEEGPTHHFPGHGPTNPDSIPSADVIFGHAEAIEANPRYGLPVVIVQGFRMMRRRTEHPSFHAPCPKVCVARWLVDVGVGLGVRRRELIHIPLGLHHEELELLRPIDDRPLQISFCYSEHFQKGPAHALRVVSMVRDVLPDVEVVGFGATEPVHDLPDWVEFRRDPPRDELVRDVYNQSRVFLQTSLVEGFGLTPVEAMACGAALVTTDNGGSRDYAVDGRTALVVPPRNDEAMAQATVSLLRDEPRRVRIATAGNELARQFDWERTGERLEEFLEAYVADPAEFGRPRASSADEPSR